MPRSDRRNNPNAVMDGYPDRGDNTTHAPKLVTEERRQGARRIADKLGGLSVSLKSNAKWTKSFLHPRGAANR